MLTGFLISGFDSRNIDVPVSLRENSNQITEFAAL